MLFSKIRKKFCALLTAGALALGVLPPTEAEAFSVEGLIIGGIQAAQMNSMVNQYNDNEKGRQEFFQAIKQQYGVNNDPELNRLLDTIMRNLSAGVAAVDPSIKKKPYNYFINKETSFNAFCTLGHNMSVNTGAFSMLPVEDELAVVIAHEMGHGQKDHPAKGMKKSILPGIIASAAGDILTNIAATVYQNQGITKPMEWEADNLAFTYITHTGYNPGACAAVWQRVMEKSGGGSAGALDWLANDHPGNQERRDNYVKKLHEYSNKHISVKDGSIMVNGKFFCTPAAQGHMSALERSYFVAGNLSAAYHNNHHEGDVTIRAGVIKLGQQEIMSVTQGDEAAETLAARLREIK